MTSDAGGVLLREVEKRTGVLKDFSACFIDERDPRYIEHELEELVSQRVYAIALGYEDLNDHDELRRDALLAALVEKRDLTGENRFREEDRGKSLAGKSTLNRLELYRGAGDRYKKIDLEEEAVKDFFVEAFVKSRRKAPKEIVLDLDATDDPLHGNQQGRFFHGYYDGYCYLPLYVFCEGFPLWAELRRSNIDVSEGAQEALERIVGILRRYWPQVRIMVRGDSGFARERLMSWCESRGVDYVFGLAKNRRLLREIEEELEAVRERSRETGKRARLYKDFRYRTLESWSRSRRVVAKAEHLKKGSNPRFVVTSIESARYPARVIYERVYCARGEVENRIKEQQLDLFADRTSSSRMRANQLRLWFSTAAYLLMHLLRVMGLKGTSMEKAQCGTIRLKLLKIGAQVRISVRRLVLSMASGYPYEKLFGQVWANLMRAGPVVA